MNILLPNLATGFRRHYADLQVSMFPKPAIPAGCLAVWTLVYRSFEKTGKLSADTQVYCEYTEKISVAPALRMT